MSAGFRENIIQLEEDIQQILDHPKTFPIPIKGPTQTDLQFSDAITALLSNLFLEEENVNEITNDLNTAHISWMSLRSNMTGAERTADNPIYDNFVATHPYLESLNKLKRYLRTLRTAKKDLQNAIPKISGSTSSIAHLPQISLPKFTGKIIEYPSFINQFQATIGNLTTISDAIKFTYLKSYLQDTPLSLIDALPITDDSYTQALSLLNKKYADPNDMARHLHQSLKSLPSVRGGEHLCPDLSKLIDSLEALCVQFDQNKLDSNSLHIQLDVESKLPTYILDDIYRAKEASADPWSTKKLQETLNSILKRKEDINAIRPYTPRKPNNKPAQSNQSQFHPNNPAPISSLTFNSNKSRQSAPKNPCIFCTENHFPDNCPKYTNPDSRVQRLRELKLCFKCTRNDHMANKCPKPKICPICKKEHPRSICPSLPAHIASKKNTNEAKRGTHSTQSNPIAPNFQPSPPTSSNQISFPNFIPQFHSQMPPISTPLQTQQQKGPSNSLFNKPEAKQTNAAQSASSGPILFKCALARIFNPNNPALSLDCIVVLDDCSNATYINYKQAQFLQLPLISQPIDIGIFNTPNQKSVPSYQTQFGLQLINGRSLLINASTLTHLTHPTKYVPFSHELFSLSQISSFHPVTPVVLIGGDYYYELEPTPLQKLPSGSDLVQTLLGPIVAGKPRFYSHSHHSNYITNFSHQTHQNITPPHDFFTLEGIGIKDNPSNADDDQILKNFNKTTKFINGRYEVELPFRADPATIPLPSNYGLAFGRLRSCLNNLSKSPHLLTKYNDIIDEQFNLGIIEKVNNPNKFSSPLHYLPHHAVINESKNKVRIVYDGSAHIGNELSLNDCLHPGPIILADLIGVLFNFRIPPIFIACDIKKSFLQISISPIHRDCIRFIWLKNIEQPISPSNIQIYRFCRVPFGLSPSPFLLAGTLLTHFIQNPSPLAEEIRRTNYVDNPSFSAETTKEGQIKCSQAINLFNSANMHLHEFISNSPQSLSKLPPELILTGHIQKFLGVPWDTESDSLILNILPPPPLPITKRSILSYMASHFDPLGLISPILLPIKSIVQKAWTIKLKWDDPLPNDLTEKWAQITKFSPHSISIPRRISTLPSNDRIHSLHCFTDASQIGMCATLYLRTFHPNSSSSEVALIFAKTKVKPSKNPTLLTIPKLELIATTIGTKITKFSLSLLSHINIDPILHLWKDSSAVLGWLSCQSPIRDIFVSNRINNIRALPNLIVHHIHGENNPADIGSRGAPSLQALSSHSLWWNGPNWLTQNHGQWPSNSQIPNFSSNNFKSNSPTAFFTFNIQNSPPPPQLIHTANYSRLPKLLRITAYFLRSAIHFCPNLKKSLNIPPYYSPLHFLKAPNLTELRFAFLFIIRQEQAIFPPPNKDNISLGLFLDPHNLIRANGRLGKSQHPQSAINPIYLPKHSPFTKLIIYESHILNSHAPPHSTLSTLRRQFWIPSGNRVVERQIFQKCISCRRYQIRPFNLPPWPDLPADRVTQNPPFSSVGLDYCGPIHIRLAQTPHLYKKSLPTTKTYVVFWVCLTTRAISLDLTTDQSGEQFLLAFRRFSAKFGNPKTIYSDNAPIFTQFNKFLQNHNLSIQWIFRPPHCAWKGGHYERFSAHIKSHLRRCLSRGIFPQISTFSHISTLLFEIETAINCRPLTFDSSNPAEERPLRPIDFMRPLGFDQNWSNLLSHANDPNDPTFPPSNPDTLFRIWSNISTAAKKFWTKWNQDYILSLRERHKKLTPHHFQRWPTIGEIVLVYDESAPRALWPLARILSIHLQENFPNTATIKLFPSNHITRRSVFHLYPLECDHIFTPIQPDNAATSAIPNADQPPSHPPNPSPSPSPDNFIHLRGRKVKK